MSIAFVCFGHESHEKYFGSLMRNIDKNINSEYYYSCYLKAFSSYHQKMSHSDHLYICYYEWFFGAQKLINSEAIASTISQSSSQQDVSMAKE